MGEAQSIKVDDSLNGIHRYAMSEIKEIVGRIWSYISPRVIMDGKIVHAGSVSNKKLILS